MPRGRPRKTLTVPEFMRRYRNRMLAWCDENDTLAADQTAPTGYIRPLTKVKEEEATIAQINDVLSSNPDFQRCTSYGTPDPNGIHWKLRELDY